MERLPLWLIGTLTAVLLVLGFVGALDRGHWVGAL